jgi:3'(2'), 5'-bisphosphate nucleotidase
MSQQNIIHENELGVQINFENIAEMMLEAGKTIMEIYDKNNDEWEIKGKNDGSPLTLADLKSSKIICDYLRKISNEKIGIICEEEKEIEWDERKKWKYFWSVDPLDGTKEFIKRNGQFTTNIGLVKDGKTIFGAVGIPVEGVVYIGGNGWGVKKYWYKNDKLTCENVYSKKHCNDAVIKVVASNSHMTPETSAFIKGLEIGSKKKIECVSSGSSIKILWVGTKKADIYPRFAGTMEWDTCGAHAIIKELGANIFNAETGMELDYGKENLLNPYFIVK